MANHGVRIRRSIERYGLAKVEDFIDTCLSLDNLIDYHAPFIQRKKVKDDHEEMDERRQPARLRSNRPYMETFINPPDVLEAEREKISQQLEEVARVPAEPEKDVLLFLIENAPLERWQRDILSIFREEAYYFAPQGMTKIMNEGWASFWHSKIMTEKACTAAEVIDYADHHSGTMGTRPGSLNPYKIGMELFRDIEERWDKGRFGPEWDECDDASRKASWDRNLGLGRQKIFEVRRIHNDVTFIDEFLTPEFCERHKLFTYSYAKQSGEYLIESREFHAVKERLLFSLSNFGQPFVCIEDANYKNRGELYLVHRFDNVPLQLDPARDAMANIFKIWQRPVHLQTVVEKRKKLLTFTGSKHEEKILK
jgi:stage V sporulation protein R